MAPGPGQPSFWAVACVRSYSRLPAYGPRSITGTRTTRPRWRNVTMVPHGSDLLATPSRPGASRPPHARWLPYRPGPYHEAFASRYTLTRPIVRRSPVLVFTRARPL